MSSCRVQAWVKAGRENNDYNPGWTLEATEDGAGGLGFYQAIQVLKGQRACAKVQKQEGDHSNNE
jgi:hypothetical protein